MPTPFYHLSIAQEILARADLPQHVQAILKEQREAFIFGNTAADVQTISGQSRQATHFYDLPIRRGDQPAWERILAAHPALAHPANLPVGQTAFMAGYLCHLQADWKWVDEIFGPVFGAGLRWQNLRRRLYLHNVLRSYLDLHILSDLKPHMAEHLRQVRLQHWLPFVDDDALSRWRDFLAGQLCDGCETLTVEVFAARQGISPDQYYDLLTSEEAMDREIFSRLSRQTLQTYRRQLVDENISMLANYLAEMNHSDPQKLPIGQNFEKRLSFNHHSRT